MPNEEAFVEWQEKHSQSGECSANPSSEMERKAVKQMFESSLEYDLRYKWLVSDGDSNSRVA